MSFRNISAWAIRNPVSPIVLFVALLLAGLVSFSRMDVNQNPDVSFPMASVVVRQPGAAPTELETQVTQRVEAAVRGISGVDEITSWVSEGESNTNVQFQIGTPVDRAVNDVKNAVDQIRSDLPEGILEPQVSRVDIDGGPIAYFSAEATDMTLEELSWYVDNTVAKRLLAVPGMAAVKRGGGVSREIRVILDPAKLQSHGITASQVNQQLQQVNLNAAGGRTEIAGAEQAIRVLGNARDAYALGQTQIAISGGRTVKLADLADVRDMYAEQRSLSLMNGRQVTSFSMEKAKGSSDVTVFDEAMKVLDQLRKENPKVQYKQLYTSVEYTKGQYHSAMQAMIEGAVLAVVIVFLFLRDWRATMISALAIPLSAIPAFWFMDMMGFTLNGISLLALSLVAGVLVDDAIVEIENIVRHMRMGKSAYQASIDAADEIGLAVLATTMAIVAVFLPVALMPGISGQFFIQFGMTVVVAVLLSLAVARLITPMIAAYFLKAHGQESHGEGWLMDAYMAVLRWSLDERKAVAHRARGGMARFTAWIRDHRIWTLGMGFLAFVATIFAFGTLPMSFQPTIDTDFSQVKIETVPGSTLQQTTAITRKVADMLAADKDMVEAAFADIQTTGADIFLTLRKDRPISSVEWERKVAPKFQQVADARVNFQSQSGGGFGRDIIIMFGSDDPVKLEETANRLVAEMAGIHEIRAPRVAGDMNRPEIVIKPRFDLAASLGVTTAALSQTIRVATIGDIDQNSAKFSLSDRQIPIRVAVAENSRRDLATIQNMPVPTVSGGSVPLKVVADIEFGAGPTQIRRYNQIRRIVVGADLAPGIVTSQAMAKIDALPTMKAIAAGKILGVQKLNTGDSKWQAEMIQNFVIAVISGIMLVLAVLTLLYKRLMPPFVNLGSLLLAPLGGAVALHLTGNPVSMPVLIGLLMLLGIVAKNSILVIDFALEEMGKGVPKLEAIIDAGHKRAQPIVMTTVAMVAGMVPTALSLGGDGAWRAPMGITVIGGLILSTVLTLVIVPATFSLALGIEEWVGPRLGRRLLTYKPGDNRAATAQPAE
ncbi:MULTISPECIES: efflux RND transporter permease subunit [Sphingobium]|jgi:multidrug efflux pump subunit AcrB|uniref:ABC transporter permease n=4 Tax=Sphingobium fuliginis (strain ATCC 27551) TaxID=336203 RepID=A0A292ZKL9_SPHSA|nr:MULTISPECIES: efflux RND transporter permease subunit [Sphingobium]AJR24083.1 ABC transporter permease [Sphingobium sp. YBL2]MCB4861010.1 efflux RND transporter permease subunit [Sphingobium sp. PNB]QDC38601.1 efflux RND transporter permease subunit [Sphingobium fuliginis ATCC 27551]QOT71000.1 efflux RND transporter permease subunit [Sphingobium fuliginis]RYL96345.1 efflux RND transporter permease subunit [Sphingobium fuliginis]